MSQDSATPDRADKADADDLDIPTFNPAAEGPTDPYKKVGRAAPQEIRPRGEAVEEKQRSAVPPKPPKQEESVEEKKPDRSAPLLSDAPTTTLERPAPEEKEKAEVKREQEKKTPAPTRTLTAAVPAGAADDRAEETPPAAPSDPAYAGASAPVVGAAEEEEAPEARRGTLDLGLLILRLGLGGWLILHSLSVFFHLGGSTGLSGLEGQYAAYAQSQALSVAIPAAGLAAGVFVLLGLITPLFAAAATVVTGFMAADALAHAHTGADVFSWPENVWLYIVLGAAALSLQFTGPGRYSLDFSRGWARRPLVSAWLGLVVSAAGLGALWWFGAGINPLV